MLIARSASALMVVVAEELLFDAFGSVVVEETVAVLVTLPLVAGAAVNVVVIVTDEPAARFPIVQGNAVVHAPLFEVKVMPAGVGSLTTTPVALDGPLFVTVIV